MIVRRKPGLKEILFAVNGSILPRVAGKLASIAAVAVAAVVAAEHYPGIFGEISAIPFTLIGIALSIFMSFRNSACYDRWWEGRKLWGAIVIACRSLGRQTVSLDRADRRFLLGGAMAFARGLSARLRGRDEAAAIGEWAGSGVAAAPNPTDLVIQRIGERCLALANAGRITPMHHTLLEAQLVELSRAQAGCERIATTPVPFAYSLLLHRTAYVFCLALPFALAAALDWWTLLPVLLVSYTFFGLDALGDQLEDPFGIEQNDLPLDALTRMIERELLSLLDEPALPPPIEPRRHVLS